MKFLALSTIVAGAAASNLVTYSNGAVAPVKTLEVQAAEAAHFAAKAATPYAAGVYGYNGYNNGLYNGLGYANGYGYNGYAHGAYATPYYNGGLVAHANGAVVPVDTPSVQKAKAEHYAAKGFPLAAAPVAYAGAYAHGYAPAAYAGAYAHGYAGAYNTPYYNGGLVAHANGAVVPVDTPAVQKAKAEHYAAKGFPVATPFAYAGAYAHGYNNGYAYGPALTVHSNGAVVPVESAEIQKARAEHLALF